MEESGEDCSDVERQLTTDNGQLTVMQQIPVPKTLDVEVVERRLEALWVETAGYDDEEAVLMRARVANLLVFVTSNKLLDEVNDLLLDLTSIHPSRVLVMLAENEASDQDIEMRVNTLCQTDKRSGAKRLCGEVVVLNAQGKFTVELPSAALPLLVSDLTTFLWWRNELPLNDRIFDSLLRSSDRLVIDSDEFSSPLRNLGEVNALFDREITRLIGVSDVNWARLTLWRGLLADFYDARAYRPLLNQVDNVRIDYVAPSVDDHAIAPQALLITGWLATCLEWTLINDNRTAFDADTISFSFNRPGSNTPITVELNRLERRRHKPGRLVEIQVQNTHSSATFSVHRSADNLHIKSEANIGADIHRGRVLPVRNRSLANLVSREMEILRNDDLYQQALNVAAAMIGGRS